MQVTVKVPGSCGELIQGMRNQKHFLITCPINCYSVVTLESSTTPGITVKAPQQEKIIKAIHKTMEYFGLPDTRGYRLTVDSDLTVGKGMASSTADMTGAIIACTLSEGLSISYEELSRILIAIGPLRFSRHSGRDVLLELGEADLAVSVDVGTALADGAD